MKCPSGQGPSLFQLIRNESPNHVALGGETPLDLGPALDGKLLWVHVSELKEKISCDMNKGKFLFGI